MLDFSFIRIYFFYAHHFFMLNFLKSYSRLTSSQQKVFLFCLEYMPTVYKHSSDVRRICICTGLSYKTVLPALHAINQSTELSRAVKYIHSDISIKQRVDINVDSLAGGS